jgi:hypothetical protein
VAVKVTDCPTSEGLTEELKVKVAGALLTVKVPAELLAAKVASPAKLGKMTP